MIHKKVKLKDKEADGYVIPLGAVNLVSVITDVGMVGCGAFDVAALDRFGIPAARVRPTKGSSIDDIEDLLVGEVKDVNEAASSRGLRAGISGKAALEML